jgi:hypothetical protein
MSTEELTYTCHYGPWKMYDESGNQIEVNRKPSMIHEEIDIEELKRFVRSVEIKAFKYFSEKIEKRLKKMEK